MDFHNKESYRCEFGEIIMVSQKLKRVSKGNLRYWEPYPVTPVKCVVIGIRTLTDGFVDYDLLESTEFSSPFIAQGRFQVYLVAVKDNLTINPFYTPIQ